MTTDTGAPAPLSGAFEANLVCGAGGSRAILGSAGVILACHLAEVDEFRSIGGASGGSIPTVLLAGGMHPTAVVRLSIETDFASKLTRHASPIRILLTYFLKDSYYKIVRPARGVFSSEKLGEYIDKHVPSWPDNYWTVAAHGSSQILFNADGVFEYTPDGKCRCLSPKPAPVGIAIRATCAIPGVFDAIEYDRMLLCDGALSIDGRTPIGAIKRHMGVVPEKIIACDVGEDGPEANTIKERIWTFLWRLVCGSHCPDEGAKPVASDGVVLIKPQGMKIRYLQFSLSRDQKWHTVMCGFRSAIAELETAGFLKGATLEKARDVVRSFEEIDASSTAPGELASRTESLLAKHGLY